MRVAAAGLLLCGCLTQAALAAAPASTPTASPAPSSVATPDWPPPRPTPSPVPTPTGAAALPTAPAPPELAHLPPAVWTLAELLERSEIIVVARIRPRAEDEGAWELRQALLEIEEVLRGGKRLGLARDVEPHPGNRVPPQPMISLGPPFPPNGRRVWFLQPRDAEGRWRIDHPQRSYDLDCLERLRGGLALTAEELGARYLSPADAAQAAAAAAREEWTEMLDGAAEGAARDGLALELVPESPCFGPSATVAVRLRLACQGPRRILAPDSLTANFFVRVRRRTDADPELAPAHPQARWSAAEIFGADALLARVTANNLDESDCRVMRPGDTLDKSLRFPADEYPLFTRAGTYELVGVYRARELTGKRGELPAFVGVLLSRPAYVVIERGRERAEPEAAPTAAATEAP